MPVDAFEQNKRRGFALGLQTIRTQRIGQSISWRRRGRLVRGGRDSVWTEPVGEMGVRGVLGKSAEVEDGDEGIGRVTAMRLVQLRKGRNT